MKSNKLAKHLKRAVSDSEARPVLKCVRYGEDGSLAATDSHRLLYIKNFHTHEKAFNQDVRTLEIVDREYPDINRLIPTKEMTKLKVTISLNVLLRVAKSLYTSNNEVINLEIGEGHVTFTNSEDKIYYGEPVTIRTNARIEGESMAVSFVGKYLIEACEFLLDAKQRYAVDDVDFYFTSPIRPAFMEIEGGTYLYLITPIRKWGKE